MRKARCKFEADRHEAAKERRGRQKECAASLLSSTKSFACPKCSRVCALRIVSNEHARTDDQTSLRSSSARNQPSWVLVITLIEQIFVDVVVILNEVKRFKIFRSSLVNCVFCLYDSFFFFSFFFFAVFGCACPLSCSLIYILIRISLSLS